MSAPPSGPTPRAPGALDAVVDVDVSVRAVSREGDLCRMVLDWPDAFDNAGAGQFALVASLRPGAPLLARPLSLIRRSGAAGLEIVFNVAGVGISLLADAVVGERVALIGPLGNRFSSIDGPVLIVADAPHVGTMLALAVERAGGRAGDGVLYVTNPDAPHPADEALLAFFQETGVRTRAVRRDHFAQILAEEAEAAPEPPFLAVGAGSEVMALAQDFAAKRGLEGEAALQAPMACGLGACKVCIHPARDGNTLLVCRGPVFRLDVPAFAAAPELA